MKRTLKCFLETALVPLGSTMYVYGGGWNEDDDGAADEARTIGLNPRWKIFFEQQNTSYDFREHECERGFGLDCSGYVGWVLYNTLETDNGHPGYVMKAMDMARSFADRGWGRFSERSSVCDYRPGDIMSGQGHVWISLGQCSDGSVVLLHSSPPGVILSGTVTLNNDPQSEAAALSEKYMSIRYPRWHEKYPSCLRGASYLADYDQFRWSFSRGILTDPDGYAIMSVRRLLGNLFPGVDE